MEKLLNQETVALERENQMLKDEIRFLQSKVDAFSDMGSRDLHFKPVADTLPLMLWFISTDGSIQFYNRKWLNYTGLPADYWHQALHPDDKRKAIVKWTKALRQKTPYEAEVRLLRAADHTYRWHLVRVQPQYISEDQIVRWIGTAVDIEDHMRLLNKQSQLSKYLEERVRERTLQLKEAQSIARLGNWEWDTVKKVINWSDELYRIFGLEPGGKTITLQLYLSLIHPESKTKVTNSLKQTIKDKKPFRFTNRIIRADGQVRTIETCGKVICDHQGKIIKITGTGQDISMLVEKENKLREAKELSENIIANTVDGINVFDKNMRYIVWNESISKITGKKPEDVLGKHIYDVYPDTEGSEYDEIFKKVLNGERIYLSDRSYFDGKGFYESYSMPMHNTAGEVIGGINIVHDITQRKEDEQKLLEMNAELMRSNQELEHFAYIASHDLKEPLRMVYSYTQLLRKKYKDKLESQAGEYMDFAIDGAERMSILINDLLEYSRIGRLNTSAQEIKGADIIEIVKKNLQSEIERTGADIIFSDLPVIKSSFTYMAQLFQNLIGNAIKFRGKNTPQIEIKAVPAGNNFLQFSIKDNGIGIEPQHIERIFVLFQRLHTREAYPGTGIGLAISKKIVEFYGGQIWVESVPGGGTTFHFTLPA